jgi:hypothetical protein
VPFAVGAQPSDAQPSDAQPTDAHRSDVQRASCRSQRTSLRLREPCPCLRSPNLARAPRASAVRRNARRRPRRPVRCPRQPRQRSTSAAPYIVMYCARQLKRDTLKFFQLSLVVSYSDAKSSSPGFTVTDSISTGRKGRYLETSAGTSDHKRTLIDKRPPQCLPTQLPMVIFPRGSCKPHYVPVYAECPMDDTSKMISPTHKRTEGRAPVWGSEFTSKRRRTTGVDPAETAVG